MYGCLYASCIRFSKLLLLLHIFLSSSNYITALYFCDIIIYIYILYIITIILIDGHTADPAAAARVTMVTVRSAGTSDNYGCETDGSAQKSATYRDSV